MSRIADKDLALVLTERAGRHVATDDVHRPGGVGVRALALAGHGP